MFFPKKIKNICNKFEESIRDPIETPAKLVKKNIHIQTNQDQQNLQHNKQYVSNKQQRIQQDTENHPAVCALS